MASPKKKQKQAAKRKADKQATRRKQSGSPIKRLAAAPGEVECWATRDFEEYGQVSIFVYKRAAGMTAVACFLVDRGVVGLKDAWTQFLESRGEFQDMLEEQKQDDITIGRIAIEDVRRRVAGGLRWAYDNGMRLPKDWQKSTELIGGLGDWQTADVSAFVLEFAGHPDDLRQRLIGQPFDDYVRRTDIAFDFSDEAPFLDQATGNYFDPLLDDPDATQSAGLPPADKLDAMADRFIPAATGLAGRTAEWLAGVDAAPSPELFEAWRSILLASMLASAAMPDASEADVADFSADLLEDLATRIPPARVDEFDRAVDQALDHTEADPQIMRKAVLKYGLTGDAPEAAE